MKMQSVPAKSDKKNLVSAENIKFVPSHQDLQPIKQIRNVCLTSESLLCRTSIIQGMRVLFYILHLPFTSCL
jgi:hypothetical protein